MNKLIFVSGYIYVLIVITFPRGIYGQSELPKFLELEVDTMTALTKVWYRVDSVDYKADSLSLMVDLPYSMKFPSAYSFDSAENSLLRDTFYFDIIQIQDNDSILYKGFTSELYNGIKSYKDHPSYLSFLEDVNFWLYGVSAGVLHEPIDDQFLIFMKKGYRIGVGGYADLWYGGFLYRFINRGNKDGIDPSVDVLQNFILQCVTIDDINLVSGVPTILPRDFINDYETGAIWK